MSIQIAVRLPDDIVKFLDELVNAGRGDSRAAIVARALEHERRRLIAERDAAIYAATGPDADMDSLVKYGARLSMELD